MKLLTAKEFEASEELRKQYGTTPVVIRHKDHLVFVSLKGSTSKQVDELFQENNRPEVESLIAILNNNSFSACQCSEIHMTPEQEIISLKASLEAAKKENESKDEKIKNLESTAKIACAKCGSTEHKTENHTKENSMNNDDDDDDDDAKGAKKAATELKAQVAKLESKVAEPMIVEMLKARESSGASKDDIAILQKSLSAKSLAEITEIYNNEKIFLTTLSAKSEETPGVHMPFNGNNNPGSLSAKSLEEILQETA
jgi:hypothetical protein